MSRQQKSPPRRPKPPAYRQAFERLDAALDRNSGSNAGERIDMARRALFGDLSRIQVPAKTVVPE
jgi:hypothetical protein